MNLRNTWTKWLQRMAFSIAIGSVATQAAAGNKVALLVGVNNYSQKSGLQDLQFAAKDVDDMRKTLLAMGYEQSDIHLLNGEDDHAPTRSNLQRAVNRLEEQAPAGNDASILIVFAGHGFNKNGNSYLCPADYDPDNLQSALPVSELQQMLEQSTAAGRFLIIDACRNEHLSRDDDEFNLRSSLAKLQSSEAAAQGVMVLSSCMPNQTSHEIGLSRRPITSHDTLVPVPQNNGVFLHYVMQGLQGAADTVAANQDHGFDGLITAGELCDFVCLETRKFVQAEFDTNQTPWNDTHGTGQLVISRLSEQQKANRPQIKVRSRKSLLDEQMAEHHTGDGVMLLVGGDEQLRPLAAKRFSEAIELSSDLYMPRRLRALLSVLEGNSNAQLAPEKYRDALMDMQHVGSNLRLAVPWDAKPIPITLEKQAQYRTASLQAINPGDVIEVNGLEQQNGKWNLRICRVNRWRTEDGVQVREDVNLQVDLATLATPAASKAQFQDVNRLRKPTQEEFRMMNNSRRVAANDGNIGTTLTAIGHVTSATGAGKASDVISGIGTGVSLIQQAKQEKQQNGRVSPNTVRRFMNFGRTFIR